jgi:hypothetical protein
MDDEFETDEPDEGPVLDTEERSPIVVQHIRAGVLVREDVIDADPDSMEWIRQFQRALHPTEWEP